MATVIKSLMIILFLTSAKAFAVCSSVSRTNVSANTVLSSSKYNTDLNTLYTRVNTFPGDCIEDGSITSAKLNQDDIGLLLKTAKRGCKVTRSDVNTLSVSACMIAVNGNLVTTTSLTNVTWGCSGCSAEAIDTTYYVYALSTSTGPTLSLLISTTAPGDTGYDASNNVILARFFNNSSSDIDQYSIDQFRDNSFVPQSTGWIDAGVNEVTATTTAPTKGTTNVDKVYFRRVGDTMEVRTQYDQSVAGTAGSGTYLFTIPSSYVADTTKITVDANPVQAFAVGHAKVGRNSDGIKLNGAVGLYSTTKVFAQVTDGTFDNLFGSGHFGFSNATVNFSLKYSVPIKGWSN